MLLSVQNLSFAYSKRQILKQLSFELKPQEILSLKGANGSGKTTLLSILAEIIQPHSGSITYADTGKNLRFAFLAADSNGLFFRLSAKDNVNFWLALPNGKAGTQDAVQLLSEWGLSHPYLQERLAIAKFSTGMKRRLGLMRVCYSGARCWILDEPFLGLDDKGREIFAARLKAHLEGGGSAIISGHEKNMLQDFATRTLLL